MHVFARGVPGGGGGDSAPAPAPVPVAKSITPTNYLDAAWAGLLGTERIELVAQGIDKAFNAVILSNDTPGTYLCEISGSLTFTKSADTRTITVNNCAATFGTTTATLISGSITSSDAVVQTVGTLTYLTSGNITLNALNADWGVGPETFSGAVSISRQANLSITARGSLNLLRNGRQDNYSAIVYTSSVPDAAGNTFGDTMTYALSTPRLATPLNVTVGATSVRSTATDNSAVEVSPADATGQSSIYKVFSNHSASAVADLSQTLARTSAEVSAAIGRLLQ